MYSEIKRRVAISRPALMSLKKIWADRDINKNTKQSGVQSLVFSIFLYGSESWTITSADRHRIDAFEMWCWRRMLRIPWTARRTNQSILNELGITDRLSTTCRKRILHYFGHITGTDEDNLEKFIGQGKVEGRKPRGPFPSRWLEQIKNFTGHPLQTNLRDSEDRQRWKATVTSCV